MKVTSSLQLFYFTLSISTVLGFASELTFFIYYFLSDKKYFNFLHSLVMHFIRVLYINACHFVMMKKHHLAPFFENWTLSFHFHKTGSPYLIFGLQYQI